MPEIMRKFTENPLYIPKKNLYIEQRFAAFISVPYQHGQVFQFKRDEENGHMCPTNTFFAFPNLSMKCS